MISLKHYFLIFLFLLFVAVNSVMAQQIAINEFMASNATTIADEDDDYEDWIEIFNAGPEDINLQGWGLSDDYNNTPRWVFSDTIIPANSYLLVWASGKDRTDGSLHTNFSIRSSGEELILSDPDGKWISEVAPVHLPTDISYGIGVTGNWLYFDQPTPGASNGNEGYATLLPLPELSHPPGFYTDSFYLKVTHPDPEALLFYTLDGSVPDSGLQPFPDSLLIYNRKNDPDQISAIPTTSLTAPEWYRWFPPMDTVFKGTNIRIKAFREGALSPFVKTATFWVDEEIFTRYSLPMISMSMDQDELLGPDGIYTRFNMTGPAWERDMHIEFFEPDGTYGFSTDAGVRVHGGNSRRYAIKSFRVYFRNAYGESSIDYPIFPEQEMNTHDRLILRNSGSEWGHTYYKDAFVQSILHPMSDVERQAYRPAIVFLNSEYWGIMNIRERFDNNYIENHYGISEIDMLDNIGQVTYGSNAHYQSLISFLHNNPLDVPENYEYVKTQMDMEDFRDYHILQVFSMNTDQPGKNVRFWRPQTSNGKWRWMWWDMDDSFILGPHNNYDRNGLVYCTGLDSISDPNVNPATPPPAWAPNGPVQTFPLRALLGSPEFRQDFINRFADLLNTAFQPEYLLALADSFELRIQDYIYEHYRRWHRPTPSQNNNHNNNVRKFSQHRKSYMNDHIVDFFELDGYYSIELDIASGMGHIRINSIDIHAETPSISEPVYPWEGTYFSGVPVEVEAIAAPGFVFSHWGGFSDSSDPVIVLDSDQNLTLTAYFEPVNEYPLISFWYFSDQLPNDTPFEELQAYFSLTDGHYIEYHSSLQGYPFDETHPWWRKASMERRNNPTSVNYRPEANNEIPYDEVQMRGIQIRQPYAGGAGENHMVFHLPSTGFSNLLFRFAVADEGAANQIIADYSVLEGENHWSTDGMENSVFELSDEYQLFKLDFRHMEEVNNNEDFKIRLWFVCDDPYADDGNRVTFNNISLEGNMSEPPVDIESPEYQIFTLYPNPVDAGIVNFNKQTDIYLFDLNGRLLLSKTYASSLDVSHLANGLYIIRTNQGYTERLVIINN